MMMRYYIKLFLGVKVKLMLMNILIKRQSLTNILMASAIILSSVLLFAQRSSAISKKHKKVEVTCNTEAETPSVMATIFQGERSRNTMILNFLKEYFQPETALKNCQTTATTLQSVYQAGNMNYLASDTLEQKPVVCLVERRGVGCDSYNSQLLFSLDRPVNPSQVLYEMLGEDFKRGQPPINRTVSRTYTDITPGWWPFQ